MSKQLSRFEVTSYPFSMMLAVAHCYLSKTLWSKMVFLAKIFQTMNGVLNTFRRCNNITPNTY